MSVLTDAIDQVRDELTREARELRETVTKVIAEAKAELERRQTVINRLRQMLHEGADHLDSAANDIGEESLDPIPAAGYREFASRMRVVADEGTPGWESMLDFQRKEISRLKLLLKETVDTLAIRRNGVGDFALSGSEHVLLGDIARELEGHAKDCPCECMGCTCPPENHDPGNICEHCYHVTTRKD